MQVYKFGGASIATPERMKALQPIVRGANSALVVVVSAMGKTTNALEDIAKAACKGDKEGAHARAVAMEKAHIEYSCTLLGESALPAVQSALAPFFTELQWAIDDANNDRFDYSYDQIVCIGELLSTRIFALYLES